MQDATATQADIARIIDSIRLRDERIIRAESELAKLTEEYRALRRELLPVFTMAKGPLPPHPAGLTLDQHGGSHENGSVMPPPQLAPEKNSSLTRKISTKMMLGLGGPPKNSSPTHVPPAIQENKAMSDTSKVESSLAANAASSHLAATVTGAPQLSPSYSQQLPSPTSPPHHRNGPTLASQTFGHAGSSGNRNTHTPSEEISLPHTSFIERDARGTTSTATSTRSRPEPTPLEPPRSDGSNGPSSGGPSVEIFKSFRVSMDDPCYKVLPDALKKYNINADWKQYALYIVFGDEERCLELEEKPLILFKQLDREGKKPMFMLRKIAPTVDGHPGSVGMSGFVGQPAGSIGGGRGPAYQSGVPLVPGGVL
ncbi:MAG: Adaptor for signal transduction [Thelocarpon superellum]|nr:MAG: Adaptor for signal transduction [Thelocarpon superellum]